eukprot:2131773-Pyramimonas_sp.AAC.1
MSSKPAPRASPRLPTAPQEGPERRQAGPKRRPKSLQEAPERTPRGPKWPPEVPDQGNSSGNRFRMEGLRE